MPPDSSRRRRLPACLVGLLGLGLAVATAEERGLPLNAREVALAEHVEVGDTVGKVRFLGMLALPHVTVSGLRFAQLSGLAWDEDEAVLYALSDKGSLFHLVPVFRDDRLVDVRVLHAYPLREPKTQAPVKWKRADAEALAIVNERNGRPGDAELFVSYERTPRVVRHRSDGYALGEEPLPEALRGIRAYSNDNRALESLCRDPDLGLLTMPEAPLRGERAGHNRLYSLSGKSWLYPVEGHNRATDMSCLGDRLVLVLERDFGRIPWRSLMALKRVRLDPAGSPENPVAVDTLVTLDSGQGFRVDNFEGIARHRGKRFFLISDDNELFIQQTLLLYLELVDD